MYNSFFIDCGFFGNHPISKSRTKLVHTVQETVKAASSLPPPFGFSLSPSLFFSTAVCRFFLSLRRPCQLVTTAFTPWKCRLRFEKKLWTAQWNRCCELIWDSWVGQWTVWGTFSVGGVWGTFGCQPSYSCWMVRLGYQLSQFYKGSFVRFTLQRISKGNNCGSYLTYE